MTETERTAEEKKADRRLFNAIMSAEWKEAMMSLEQAPRPDINQLIAVELSARSSSGERMALAIDGVRPGVDSLFTMALRRHMFPICDKMIEMGVDVMLPDGRGAVVRQIIQNDTVAARYMQARLAPQKVGRQVPLSPPVRSLERCAG